MNKLTTSLSLAGLLFAIPALSFAENLQNFSATFHVQVASFNIGQGTHTLNCKADNCVLKSSAKPSGFIRNFFKDELYETSNLKQTADGLIWLNYTKRDVKYKNDQVFETLTRLEKQPENIVYLEKNKHFPLIEQAFDPMSIAYALQWLRLNTQPQPEFEKLKLQTAKQQSKIDFKEFAKTTSLGFDFANHPLETEFYRFATADNEVSVWLLKKYQWFPGKIQIVKKDKDRKITLNLAKQPKFSAHQ